MTLELDLKFMKWKPCTKFQLNISKHVGEKCGKLYFQYSKLQKGNSYNQSCQKDNIARRRQPYVNSNKLNNK